jgi:hypothetical protein
VTVNCAVSPTEICAGSTVAVTVTAATGPQESSNVAAHHMSFLISIVITNP